MKTILIILVFFFSLVSLVEMYANVQFQAGPEGIKQPGIPYLGGGGSEETEWYCTGLLQYSLPCSFGSAETREWFGSPLGFAITIAATGATVGGILGGLFGAGQKWEVGAAAGIGLGVFYYINTIISQQFVGMPLEIMVLFNGLIGVFFLYMIVKLLRG